MTSTGTNDRSHLEGETRKIGKLGKRSLYEQIVYTLDVLVPEDEEDEIFVPRDSYLQQVHYGRVHRWRVQRNSYRNLPEYLTDQRDLDEPYIVMVEKKGLFTPLDLGSPFYKKWDALSFVLLIYTALVTPWETAFDAGETKVNVLFLLNTLVDLTFFADMFVQMRTPYRDPQTGKMVRDVRQITMRYLRSWFPIDLVSVLPFEYLGFLHLGSNLSQLQLLRFLRLARLLKLIRVFRASRKVKQWQIHSGLRLGMIQAIKTIVITIFVTHWLACGYRLSAERVDPSLPLGWVDYYAAYTNNTSPDPWEIYLVALYWSISTISLVGTNFGPMAPTNVSEFGYCLFAYLVAYLLAGYFIASTASFLSQSSNIQLSQDILVDNYLEMFDTLKLDQRLKFKVFEHLTDHFAAQANQRQTKMLRDLPVTLHGFIALEMFLPFIEMIPYLEVFIDRDPQMIQDICRVVEIHTCAPNNFLFTEGIEGIYFIEHGIVAIEGRVYPSGSIFGRTCLRETIKKSECRALTDVQYFLLPRAEFIKMMARFPKVRYYAKRWTAWQLLREYIMTYTRLYFTAAKRGAKLSPPLLSRRPNLAEGDMDDIDFAVLDHIADVGF
ncbi:hypothetical protein HK105_202676 [Polyrhizophydium stewartii]|uniref:Ion transport domain-containing protein n=1 Tax=Polyrhizophydium stewartii TaxID=2732419 RepID=A0ABR4NE51_9FUNG